MLPVFVSSYQYDYHRDGFALANFKINARALSSNANIFGHAERLQNGDYTCSSWTKPLSAGALIAFASNALK